MCCLLLAVLAVLAYLNSFAVPFLFDDTRTIERAAVIRPPVSLQKLLGTPRPVVTATLAFNYALGGLDVFGYHALNLLAHVVCGLLVYGFARYTLLRPAFGRRFATNADWIATIAAGIFLLHPIQTGCVTYVTQRAEVLAAIWVLLGLWIAAVAAERIRHAGSLLALAAVGLLGVYTKPLVVVLPFLFALYDWCFRAQGRVRTMLRCWPIYLVLTAIALGASLYIVGPSFWIGRGDRWLPDPSTGFAMEHLTPWRYYTYQFGLVLYYLRLVALPDNLCFDCGYLAPWPVLNSALGDRVWLPALVMIGGGVVALRARSRYPLLTFSLLGSLLVLAPTSAFPLADVYVEYRLYLPVAFIAMLGTAAAFDASEAMLRRGWMSPQVLRALRVTTALAVWAALGSLTVARNDLLADPLRLWQNTVAKTPQQSRAHNNLGVLYRKRGQMELALRHFREAVRLGPPNARVFVNVGLACAALGRNAEAVDAFEAARARDEDAPLVHHNLAVVYPRLGRFDDALEAAQRAVALRPSTPRYRKTLAALYARRGQVEDAQREYREAAQLDPNDRDVQRRLAALEAEAN